MSCEEDKIKHSKRIHSRETHIKKRARDLKTGRLTSYHKAVKEPHRLHKNNAFTCGNANCVMCMNPRKASGELTIQEKRFFQDEKITD